MSKQSKGLAGFGAVANDPKNERVTEVTVDTSTNTNFERDQAVNSNIDQAVHQKQPFAATNSLTDIIDSVTKKPKQIKKRQISTYIDEDVARKLDKFGKEHGKGAKSELINNFLKNALK